VHETWLGTHDDIRIYIVYLQHTCENIASKHDTLQAINFVYSYKFLSNSDESLLVPTDECQLRALTVNRIFIIQGSMFPIRMFVLFPL